MAISVEKKGAENNENALIKNRKALIYGVLAIIIIIAGYLAYKTYYAEPREDEASTAIAKGQDYFANQQFDKAFNGDGAGFKGFKAITSDYSGTKAGNLANLYAGLCCANLDKWKEAASYLENYSSADDMMISPAAVADEAEDNTNNSLSPTFLIKAGEILESQNKKDEALQIYQDIKKKYVNSAAYQQIDKYIERATTK